MLKIDLRQKKKSHRPNGRRLSSNTIISIADIFEYVNNFKLYKYIKIWK